MSIMLSRPQTRVLLAIAGGAAVTAYNNDKGALCFKSDADGIGSTLYLTITCRSLLQRQYIDINNCEVVFLTATGKLVADNS